MCVYVCICTMSVFVRCTVALQMFKTHKLEYQVDNGELKENRL